MRAADYGAYVARFEARAAAFEARWGAAPPAGRARGGRGSRGGGDGSDSDDDDNDGAGVGAGAGVGVDRRGGRQPVALVPAAGERDQQEQQQEQQQQQRPGAPPRARRPPPRYPDPGDPVAWLAAARRALAGELARGEAPEGASLAALVEEEWSERPSPEDPWPPPAWLLEGGGCE